eukprot:11400136-Alexandrium_andersonii.AAC.2
MDPACRSQLLRPEAAVAKLLLKAPLRLFGTGAKPKKPPAAADLASRPAGGGFTELPPIHRERLRQLRKRCAPSAALSAGAGAIGGAFGAPGAAEGRPEAASA